MRTFASSEDPASVQKSQIPLQTVHILFQNQTYLTGESIQMQTVTNEYQEMIYEQCCLFSDPYICLYIFVLLKHALSYRNKYCLN